ncbi:MAG: hypothetical protein JWM64_2218, partial [Frankiales bacterium]|nr:hypothetical protein [Frankiales bacterium]
DLDEGELAGVLQDGWRLQAPKRLQGD